MTMPNNISLEAPVRILFVCLGNICRSPSAEGVVRAQIEQQGLESMIQVDSAGTAAWHIGKSPDPRAVDSASARGYSMAALKARQVSEDDFDQFDYILAMDSDNLSALESIKPQHFGGHLGMLLDFLPEQSPLNSYAEVPDPYYGGGKGFELVLDLIESAGTTLLQQVQQRLA